MVKLEKYLQKNLYILFLSMFIPLFAIASVIFMIKLATYTAIIHLSILDMAKLYMFVLPEILFFTLPLTFFVTATLALFKLSNDNEIIVLFSLGISPTKILNILLKPALFLSLIMFLNFTIVFPHTKVLSQNFISHKKSEAKFNLGASEFGHSFGEWLLYIGKENPDETYGDVVLFNKNKDNEEIIISAKRATIINGSGILSLKLMNGKAYSYSKKNFSEIEFHIMYINDTVTTNLVNYSNALEYWLPNHKKDETPIEYYLVDADKKFKKSKFALNALLSIFPIISIFLALSIGIVHVRHHKAKVYLYIFIGIALYYALAFGLSSSMGLKTIPLIFIIWLSATYYIYKKMILTKF